MRTGPETINPQQVALGKVLRFQIQGAWKLAAETAHQGTIEFPRYFALFAQEASSWLGVGEGGS